MLTFLQRKQAGVLYIWGAKGGKLRDSEKVYSKEELLNYLYKYGNIPVILFAKDKEGKYVYASENPENINGKPLRKRKQKVILCQFQNRIHL